MQLTYRGISYNQQPSVVETTEGEAAGKFRGLDWRFRNLKKPPVLQPTLNLTYRGVTYNHGETPAANEAVTQSSVTTTQQKARFRMLDRQRTAHNRQQSMLQRAASEIGLALS